LIFHGPKAWTLISRSPASNLSPTLNKKKKRRRKCRSRQRGGEKIKMKKFKDAWVVNEGHARECSQLAFDLYFLCVFTFYFFSLVVSFKILMYVLSLISLIN
jgi:hypothetical protein